MPQSLDNVLVHMVFSTKNRTAWIAPPIEGELHAYLVGVLRNHGCRPVQVGGIEDHVHLLFALSRSRSLAQIAEELKSGSSKWMKTRGIPGFAWQAGYGVFSVSPNDAEGAIEYVRRQREHHRGVSFMDEFRSITREAGVEMDERYVWD